MADNRESVKEVPFEKAKHGQVQKGALVGSDEGGLGVVTYEMPHEVLFDVGARDKLPEDIKKDLAAQNLKLPDAGRKA